MAYPDILSNRDIDEIFKDTQGYNGCTVPQLRGANTIPLAGASFGVLHLRTQSHWCAYYHDSDSPCVEHFDPLGNRPGAEVARYLRQLDKPILYNSKKIQPDNSKRCSYYCCYYLLNRIQGRTYVGLLQDFSSDLAQNEDLISDFQQNLLSSLAASTFSLPMKEL